MPEHDEYMPLPYLQSVTPASRSGPRRAGRPVAFYACRECGATVEEDNCAKHAEWHAEAALIARTEAPDA